MSANQDFLSFVHKMGKECPSSKNLCEAVEKGYKVCFESATVSPYMIDTIHKAFNWDKDDIVGFLTDYWDIFVKFYNQSGDVADAFKETLSLTDSMVDRADAMMDAD